MMEVTNIKKIMPDNLINIVWTTYYSIYKMFDDNQGFIWRKNNKTSAEMIVEKFCIRIPFFVYIENSSMEREIKEIVFEKLNNKIGIMQDYKSNIIKNVNKQYIFEYQIIFKDEKNIRSKILEDKGTYLLGKIEFALKLKNC